MAKIRVIMDENEGPCLAIMIGVKELIFLVSKMTGYNLSFLESIIKGMLGNKRKEKREEKTINKDGDVIDVNFSEV